MKFIVEIALMLFLGAVPATASSCIEISVCRAYSDASIPLIFRGEVVDVTAVPSPPPSPLPPGVGISVSGGEMDSVRFLIREVLKGKNPGQEITLTTSRGTYRTGREYLVYVGERGPNADRFANRCVHQQDASQAESNDSDLKLLRFLSSANGSGAIFGRLYLGGTNLGGDVAPLGNTNVAMSISGAAARDTQTEHGTYEQVYLFTGLPPGNYLVTAKPATGVAATPVAKEGGQVSLAANSCQDVDWFLRVDNHIRGRVTDEAGQPVTGADVGLFKRGTQETDLERGRFAPLAHLVTDADGRYDFDGANPGDYSVVLHPYTPNTRDPYPPVFYPAAALPSDAKVLHLGNAETLQGIDLVRPQALRPAIVHVSVKRANGTAVEDAMVIVSDPASSTMTAATGRTDANGYLDLSLFTERTYWVTASTPDPNGQPQESPQCAGPVEFVAVDGMDLVPLVPDKTFHACRSAARPALPMRK